MVWLVMSCLKSPSAVPKPQRGRSAERGHSWSLPHAINPYLHKGRSSPLRSVRQGRVFFGSVELSGVMSGTPAVEVRGGERDGTKQTSWGI